MVLKGNSVGNRICLKFGAGINELSGRGRQMTSQLELNSRAALCRQLAKREPTNRALWMAEAENWSRLSKEKLRGEATAFPDGGILTNHNPPSLKLRAADANAEDECVRGPSLVGQFR